MENKALRLDIGFGGVKYAPEYIGVDPYFEGAEVKAFADKLPYKDNSVDEIYCSHVLEHVAKLEVIPTLKEWHRVLKPQGKLILRVPDLVWCCERWLKYQTTGWEMDIIFGNQGREGEFHKTGFNKGIMMNYLKESGFICERYEEIETHSQKTLSFECKKI